ncbi:MAG: sigma-70 family RNA polymerase sigma factor [Phycisphaerae bacterium]|nr:sigma-70 family RNA polymerase sigma factor [Phycisphaerae bacterium]
MTETDTFYIGRCKNGHPDDFRFLVKRYQGALMGHLMGRVDNRDTAEEAAQESLVRAYFKIDTLKKPDRFFTWLLGISDRVALELCRTKRVQKQREHIRIEVQQAEEPSFSQDYVLEEAVSRLPDNYRHLILLRYYSQMSCRQIAEQLQIPLGTVTKTLSRAYALLRQTLTQSQTNESEVAG